MLFCTQFRITSSTSTVIAVSPSYVLIKEDYNFTVAVLLTDSPSFMGFSLTVNYNTTVLDALNGNVTVPWVTNELIIDEGAGTISMSSNDFANPLEGNQTLAMIEFHAVAHSNSSLTLSDTVRH